MKSRAALERDVAVLEERISTLSAAVLRIGSSLDLPTVLQEAADSARALTRARYSLIVTIDEAGEVREFVTEYELLRLLTVNAGRVSTYQSLIRQLWDGLDAGDPDRVRTFIKQLRRKLGDDPKRPAYILNERGVGYRVPKPEE